MLAALADAVGIALLGLGLLLATIGLYGMLRRPELLHRLHAAGLVTGPATVLVLLASLATGTEIVTSAALVILFVLLTAPLASHAIGRAALDRAREESGARR
jgi:multicomponent Na+:H+ antiporter subunit G